MPIVSVKVISVLSIAETPATEPSEISLVEEDSCIELGISPNLARVMYAPTFRALQQVLDGVSERYV